MSLYCAVGSTEISLSQDQLRELLNDALAELGPRNAVLAVPPDQSREHSQAGLLTRFVFEHYGERLKAVLPAIGTHTPMRADQIAHMFGAMPQELFRVHNWRTEVETLGEIPAEFIR
ncbi:MAG: D-mannonate epimerase, partial [Terracidiphilus sp.]